jgi:DNA/RNA endonuclease YhcR with UshA esterase domain
MPARPLPLLLAALLSALLFSGCFWQQAEPEDEASPTAVATAASAGSAAPTTPPPARSACPNAIDWSKAADNIGKQGTVRGPVVRATYASSSNGKPTFIDLGKPYPDPGRFNVVIWGSDRTNFPTPPENAYTGKTICVTGLIATYRGVPQIIVSAPGAIVVE